MSSTACIEQSGIVEDISNGIARIKIATVSACGHCNSKESCSILQTEDRYLNVPTNENTFSKGDHVSVSMEKELGMKAVLIAYLLPFILLLSTLIVLSSIQSKELVTGLLSIGILVPYYIVIYFFRDRLNKKFTFRLRKEF